MIKDDKRRHSGASKYAAGWDAVWGGPRLGPEEPIRSCKSCKKVLGVTSGDTWQTWDPADKDGLTYFCEACYPGHRHTERSTNA